MAFDFPPPPSPPTPGQTITGPGNIVFQWDGTKWVAAPNTNAWAPINSPVLTGDPQAPTAAVGDNDSSLATTAFVQTAGAGALHNVGRNLLHNGLMNIAQRGTGAWTAQGYTLDRWLHVLTSDAISVQQIALSDVNRAAIGDEAARFAYYNNFVGNAAPTAFNFVTQHIEDMRRLAGKTVTVSFWATAGSGTPKLGVSIDQLTGTGGSATPNVLGNGQSVTLSTTPTRYSVTLAIGSSAGLTLGTNNDHCTGVNFWFSAGTNFAVRSGGVGVQTAIIWLWGIQLEIGSVATPLEKLDPRVELSNCQRYYWASTGRGWWFYTPTVGSSPYDTVSFPVKMRAAPTATVTATYTNGANGRVVGATADVVLLTADAVAAGWVSAEWTSITASADL